jgi:hypothetical protein
VLWKTKNTKRIISSSSSSTSRFQHSTFHKRHSEWRWDDFFAEHGAVPLFFFFGGFRCEDWEVSDLFLV